MILPTTNLFCLVFFIMDIYKQLDASVDDSYSALTSSINSHGLTTVDLLHYAFAPDRVASSSTLAKKLGRSVREIDNYLDLIKEISKKSIQRNSVTELGEVVNVDFDDNSSVAKIESIMVPTGLKSLDKQLGGGIPIGELTEIFGSSGSGKSQLLLLLSIQWQLSNSKKKKCVYISTESPLETRRLESISNSRDNTLMDNVIYIYCPDLESQDHIIQTQLPVLLTQDNDIGLVIIDSISHHLRREDAISNISYLQSRINLQEAEISSVPEYKDVKMSLDLQHKAFFKSTPMYKNLSSKTYYILSFHRQLQILAKNYSLAILIANQVSDAFDENTGIANQNGLNDDPLFYNNQLAFFSGWDKLTIIRHLQKIINSPISNEIYSELMRTFDNTSKRRKINKEDEDFDPRKTKVNTLNGSLLSETQQDLLNKLHLETNYTTKKYLPALGYQWSRRISNRILLMKTYRPNIEPPAEVDPETGLTYDQLCRGFEFPEDSQVRVQKTEIDEQSVRKQQFNQQVSLSDLVTGWSIERYFKVVFSSHMPADRDLVFSEKIPFRVDYNGIEETEL